jgi:hypothetical protein
MAGLRTCLSSLSRSWPGLVSALLSAVACGPRGPGPAADADSDGETSTTDASETSTTSSSTPEPTTEDTTSDDSSEATLTFVVAREFIEGNPCDPFSQDCPEGEKCVAHASSGEYWNGNTCVPVTGSQAAGEPCSYAGVDEAFDDCDANSACWNVQEIDGEWSGVCRPFCMGTADDPECTLSTCLIGYESSVSLCVPACDPLIQDCAEGLGCFWSFSAFDCVATSVDIPIGEPCEYVNDCAPGLFCVAADFLPSCAGTRCCSPFCDLNLGDADCAVFPGTSCVVFFDEGQGPMLPGYEHLGVCVVP